MKQGYFPRIGFFLFAFFFWSIALCAPALSQSVQLPQTGQTHCYNTVPAEIACAGTGQDGELQTGVAWPDPRFTSGTGAEADCMIDNLTGLMWPKNGNLPGARLAWTDAIDYANSLDLCGHSDWHLPNRNELESLVNADVPNVATWLNAQGFSNVSGSTYWSSSTYVLDKVSKWYVNFVNGHVNWSGQAVFAWYVWPVRATTSSPAPIWQTGQTQCYDSASGVAIVCAGTGQDGDIRAGVPWPIPRFSDHGDGTVTDNLTGLMWTENANAPGPSTCSPGTGKPWQSALDYVACLNTHTYLGYTDWHLPNRKELFSLIDLSNFNPALPTGHPFQNVHPNDRYWSSTSDLPGTYAWFVFMWDGLVSSDPKDIIHPYYVWPVRSGEGPLGNPVISVTPNPVKFGSVNVGATSDQTATIKNDGNANLVIGTITNPIPPFTKIGDNCSGQTIPPNGACIVTYQFAPTAADIFSSNSNIPSNDPDENIITVTLIGTGAISFLLNPNEGTYGTEIAITGSGFGSKKGKASIGSIGLTVLEWKDDFIKCSLKKVVPPGTYDVTIQPSGPKGTPSIVEKDAFVVRPAEIHSTEQSSGSAYDQVTITGKFFGTKKGAVYLEYEEGGSPIRISCKVLSWVMDPTTGDSEIVFVVPKMLPEVCNVVVDPYSAIQETEEGHGFEVRAPEIGSVNPNSGSVGEQITISGNFFGSKKPKVYLGYMSNGKPVKKSCSVVSWSDDAIIFTVPKLLLGTYDVIVSNSVNSDTSPGGFIIK